MKIHYKDEKEKSFYEDKVALIQRFGERAAENIIQRISELDAADCILDLPPAARAHPRYPKNEGVFYLDILKHKHPLRLLILAEGEFDLVDYKTITEFSIYKIEKVHS